MKRPLALIGLTSMLVLTVCFYADFTWLKWIFGLSLAGLVISLAVKKLRKKPEFTVFFAVVLISVTFFNLFSQFYVKPMQSNYSGKTAEITAVLLDEPEIYNSSSFYPLKTVSINDEHKSVKIILGTNTEIKCKVGDTLKFTTELESAGYDRYLADRFYLTGYTYEHVDVTEAEHKPLYYYIVKIRQNLRNEFYTVFTSDTAGLISAVLLGDRNFNSDNYENLRRAGLTHIVVVSGLHLSIITMTYAKTIGKRIKNKYVNAFATILPVLFFLCLTGFGKSSIRAAIMLLVLIVSKLFKRQGDSLNSLGLAAILLCLNPYVVGDVGVLLSFSATFGIVVFSTPLYKFLTQKLKPEYESDHKYINKSVRKLARLVATTLVAVLCTLPVNVLFFGKVSLVQLFANLLVVPMIKWLLIALVLCICSNFLCLPIYAYVFSLLTEIIGKLILYVAKFFSSIPVAYVKADYNFVLLWIISVIILFSFAYFIKRNGKGLHIVCIVISMLIFVTGSLGHIVYSQNTLTVYVIPSNYGQSIVLSSKDGNILICSTDYHYPLTSTQILLEDIYTEKQLAVITDKNQADYISALFDYEEVLMYDNICKNNCKITLWDKAELYVFEKNGEVYTYLTYADTTMLILPDFGDVKYIPEKLRCADVLVTSGLIDNMELLSFSTLISNGNDFRSLAVIDYFRNRDINAVSVSDTINFDIVG